MKFIDVSNATTPEIALENIFNLKDTSMKDMVSPIANILPSILSGLNTSASFVSKLKEAPSDLFNSLTTAFFAGSSLQSKDFAAFTKLKVAIPEGFTGNMLEYTEFVERSWIFTQTSLVPQLDIIYASLAAFASNKANKISLVDSTKTYQSLQASLDGLIKESTVYFGKAKHNVAKVELGVVYNDFYEVEKVREITLRLGKGLKKGQVDDIVKKIKKIADVLEIIISDAKSGSTDKASYEAVKSMAQSIFTVAAGVEYYSVTYYRITELGFIEKENKEIFSKI